MLWSELSYYIVAGYGVTGAIYYIVAGGVTPAVLEVLVLGDPLDLLEVLEVLVVIFSFFDIVFLLVCVG